MLPLTQASLKLDRLTMLIGRIFLCALIISFNATAQNDQNSLEELDRLFKLGQFEDVIDKLDNIPREQYTSEHFRFLIFSYAEEDLDDAEDAADQAIKQLSTNPDVYLMHASIMGAQASNSIFSALSYAEKALNSLEKAVELAPEETKYRQALVSFHLNAPSIAGGDTDIALEQIKIIESKDMIEGKILLAWYYRTEDKHLEALNILEQANADFPNNISVLNALASHFVAIEDYPSAIKYYQDLTSVELVRPLDNEPGVIEEYDQARYSQLNAHYQIARSALIGKTHYKEGIEHMNQFINTIINPDAIGVMDTSGLPSIDWAHLRLAGLYLANEQKEKAQSSFAKVSLDKNDDNMQDVYTRLKKRLK